MKTENALLIGGTRDGEWIVVQEGQPLVDCPAIWQMPMPRRLDEMAAPDAAVTFEVDRYYRTTLNADDGTRHPVYVLQGVNLIEELLNGYRRPK